MPTIQIFDPALCCSSGVCGQDVDTALVHLAADLAWVKQAGGQVERFNLSQQPLAFAQHDAVRALLEQSGPEVLPVTVLDGQVLLAGRYPTREQLTQWLQLGSAPEPFKAASCCGTGSQCC